MRLHGLCYSPGLRAGRDNDQNFKQGEFTGGRLHGSEQVGALPAAEFHRQPDVRNVLPDGVITCTPMI
jgi:hypothetical protein